MLKINFANLKASKEIRDAFETAVNYEFLDMTVAMNNALIASLDTKIANKADKYTEDEIEVFKEQRSKLETAVKNDKSAMDGIKPVFEEVVANMTAKNKDGFGNEERNVKNVLRLIACADNTKLEKYAINVGCVALYEALETCHDINASMDDGRTSMKKDVKIAFQTAEAEIQSILKIQLSLPFDTPYTTKMRVKFNAKSMRMIHESYITGYSNKYVAEVKKDSEGKATETGYVKYSHTAKKAMVTAKKSKDGKVKYNWDRFNAAMVRFVITYISEVEA